jgi:transposase InsO family protein
MAKKKRAKGRTKAKPAQKAERGLAPQNRGPGNAYPVEFRFRVVQAVVEEDLGIRQTARVFGIRTETLKEWLERYQANGIDGLVPLPCGGSAKSPPRAHVHREAVVALREEHPEYGTRRIRDVLARFEALGVSENQVRRILHEAGLIEPAPPVPRREKPPRRFERALPNQMWQSDIFTFLLRRHQRVYVCAFLDDCSRFVVSYATAHHQRTPLVLEALERGIAAYGTPREILTDQGRQYTAWRGESQFTQRLRQYGIQHVKSRPQHPQTLGKVERFWKTLWDEFLSRTVFADFADYQRRLALYVDGYNFQRPHQGIAGLVPADRFFRAAPQVRAAVEAGVKANALRLAREQAPRKPFYLVGRLGDQDLSVAAEGGGLRVQVGDTEPQTIRMPKEEGDDANISNRSNKGNEAKTQDASALAAEIHRDRVGPGRDGAAAVLDDPERAEWGARGHGGNRGGEDYPDDLLQPGDQGAARDAGRADASVAYIHDVAGRCSAEANRGAGGEGGEAGEETTEVGAFAAPDPQGGKTGPGNATAEADASELTAHWDELFAQLESEITGEQPAGLDPDDGWRGRALTWDRKLAGQDAELPQASEEACGEQGEAAREAQEELRGGPIGAGPSRGTIQAGAAGAVGRDLGERGGATLECLAEPLPEPAASGHGGTPRGAHSEAAWPAEAVRRAGRSAERDRPLAPREREAQDPGRHGRAHDRRGERRLARPGQADRSLEAHEPGNTDSSGSTGGSR